MLPINSMRTSIALTVSSLLFVFLCVVSGTTTVNAQVKPIMQPPNQVNSVSSGCDQAGEGTIANPLKFCTLEQLFEAILNAIVKIGTIALTFAFIFLGFQYVAARGNAGKIAALHKSFLYTVVGGLILLGALGIGKVIQATVQNITS